MIERLGVGLLGTLLLAIAIVFAIGPRRALAAFFAVPLYAVAMGGAILAAWYLFA